MLLTLGLATAFEMPWVVRGKVTINDRAFEFQEIQIQHIRNGNVIQVAKVPTYSDGSYQYDITQFTNRVYDTEELKVVVCTDSSSCEKSVYKDGSGGKWVEFNITDPMAKVKLFGGIISVGVILLLSRKFWFKGFLGLVKYWYTIRYKKLTAKKMINSLNKRFSKYLE